MSTARVTLLSWLILAAPGVPAVAQSGRPGEDEGPTEVRIAVFVLDIDAIDNVNQSFDANLFVMCRWRDPSLAHGGKGQISFPLTAVWHPRMQIVNRQRMWMTFPDVVEVSPDGEVVYRQRGWGSFSQPLDLHDFPFDRQVFSIQLAAAGYTSEEVSLVPDPERASGIADKLSLPDWDIVNFAAETKPYNPQTGEEREGIAGFAISFEARRHHGYYVAKVIVPLVLIVAMSCVVFWIDPKESATRISVSVTTMLTLIAYRFAVGMELPRVSYLTRLDYFILLSTVLIFSTLLEVVTISALARRGKLALAQKVDVWSRWVFPAAFLSVGLETLVLRIWL